MTAAPEMRDLAHRLLTYEASAGKDSEPLDSPTQRVYEKLRRSLGEFVGAAGFQLLASRALTLAKPEVPRLAAVRVVADGSLHSRDEIESPFEIDTDMEGDGGVILIARLLGLLEFFLGETLTLSLLRNAWPGEVIDNHNSAHGRST